MPASPSSPSRSAIALTAAQVAPQDPWAGYRLWSIDALGPVVDAWASAMSQIGDALSTSLSVLRTPPGAPAFPPALQGVPVVHLAFASPQGADAAAPLLRALEAAPAPAVNSNWARADAARLAQIHLDPPNPVPALGIGRWLGPHAVDVAAEVLGTAAAPDSPVAVVEFRNLGNAAPTRDGAMTAVPGPFLLHAVGLAADAASGARTERGLAEVQATAMRADIGLAAASFADGRAAVEDGLDRSGLQRLVRIRTAVDPERRLAPSRLLAAANDASRGKGDG
ncbi:hypothetical protein [Mycobacterium sp. E3305]|uniref:hypothetical protein n=1 Tax=Mycobacterium sp. E3305 TaxID=1834145 RepID=UPI0012E800E8|nr:hypothetical protein [Mycobacterium sp. E3305]